MNNNINVVSLTVAILSAVKLILESFQIDVINDNNINDIANGVAAILTIVGVMMSHRKPKEAAQNEFTTPIEPSA